MKYLSLLKKVAITLVFLVVPVGIVSAEDIPAADVTVTTWAELQQEIDNASTAKVIKLGGNIVALTPETASDIDVSAGKDITINLNGYVLDRGLTGSGISTVTGEKGSVIQVHGTLTIVDGNPNAEHKGTLSENGYFWKWDGGSGTGDTVIKGGIITGGSRTGSYNGGSGVRVYNNTSIFNMKGGTIAGNKSLNKAHAGGVYVNYGNFNMSGGGIKYNTAVQHGAGIFIRYGKCTMSGTAKVTKNSVSSNGGGIYIMNPDTSSFTMNGGEISYNKGNTGGGIRGEKEITINGGVIKNNIANSNGGGIASAVVMTGGEISRNTASGNGGGITGNVTMTGGKITGNTSSGNGGGISSSNITLGGTAKINGNLKGTTTNNVYLDTDKVINISSVQLPTNEMNIGVTSAVAPVVDSPVAITSNGSEADVSLFFSDNPNYFVRFNTDHIELHAHDFTGDYIEYDTINHKWAKRCSCGEYDTQNALIGVEVPTAKTNLTYNGKEQIGVLPGTGYTITNNKGINVSDSYKATATLKDGYIWSDGTFEPKEIDWSIAKANLEKTNIEEVTNPKTGDTSNFNLWITMFILSFLGLCTCFAIGKKNF